MRYKVAISFFIFYVCGGNISEVSLFFINMYVNEPHKDTSLRPLFPDRLFLG